MAPLSVAHPAVGVPAHVARRVADDEPPESPIADQDVGAEAEHEVRQSTAARDEHGGGQLIGRGGLVEEIGRAADLERGVRSERLGGAHARGAEPGGEVVERARAGGNGHDAVRNSPAGAIASDLA